MLGETVATRVPILDSRLEAIAGTPTTAQQRVSTTLVWVTRKLAKSKAFEHLMLRAVKDCWPGSHGLREDVKLCL